uniref:Uncharacterized protein n=1 Tax=Anguilla anguilla TaxID=7936 RepID=A0A0E9XVK6_ANGAN
MRQQLQSFHTALQKKKNTRKHFHVIKQPGRIAFWAMHATLMTRCIGNHWSGEKHSLSTTLDP